MVEAARRYARVVQTGSEARSQASCRFACELVRNGRIGRMKPLLIIKLGSTTPALARSHGDMDAWIAALLNLLQHPCGNGRLRRLGDEQEHLGLGVVLEEADALAHGGAVDCRAQVAPAIVS